jgi:hypothetical protein
VKRSSGSPRMSRRAAAAIPRDYGAS